MNTISKTHKRFSERLRNPRVLENPEEFLGPNFEEVLNFWMILDDLSEEQLRVVKGRFWDFYCETRSEWDKAKDLANGANDAGWAACNATNSRAAFYATRELIGMHLILEKQPLTFFNMFLKSYENS